MLMFSFQRLNEKGTKFLWSVQNWYMYMVLLELI